MFQTIYQVAAAAARLQKDKMRESRSTAGSRNLRHDTTSPNSLNTHDETSEQITNSAPGSDPTSPKAGNGNEIRRNSTNE